MSLLQFDEKSHSYYLGNKKLSSVTEICSVIGHDIYPNSDPYRKRLAAEKGSVIHGLCCYLDYEGEVEAPPDCSGYVVAYLKFLAEHSVQWQFIERPIYSEKLLVAGTIDRFGMIDGDLSLLDIKTGGRIHKDLLSAQLNGYRMILQEKEYQNIPIVMYGLQLKKDGKYIKYTINESDIFQLLLNLRAERMKINGTRFNGNLPNSPGSMRKKGEEL